MKLIKKADIILIISVLVLVLLWFLLKPESESVVAVVSVNCETVKTVDLSKNERQEIIIGNMHICADNGKVWVSYSDCPDKTCCKAGKIKGQGQMIACVPNGVVILIEGGKVDGVTG